MKTFPYSTEPFISFSLPQFLPKILCCFFMTRLTFSQPQKLNYNLIAHMQRIFLKGWTFFKLSNPPTQNNSLLFKSKFFFAKKDPQKKKPKSYSMEGVDETKIPSHLRKIYNVKKEALSYEVVSEADMNQKKILESVKAQRNEIQSEDSPANQQPEQAKESLSDTNSSIFCLAEKFLGYLTGANFLTAGIFALPFFPKHQFYLGIVYSFFSIPSLYCAASIAIGINLAGLIVRQGLNMYTPLDKLSKVDLASSPGSYYLEASIIGLQMITLLCFSSQGIFQFFQPNQNSQLIFLPLIFTLTSVQAHSYYISKDFINKKYQFPIHATCLSLMILLVFSLGAHYGEKENGSPAFREGSDLRKSIWKKGKVEIDKNEKITALLKDDQEK